MGIKGVSADEMWLAAEHDRRHLPADTRFPRIGEVYVSLCDFEITYLTHHRAPYKGGGTARLPPGECIRVQSFNDRDEVRPLSSYCSPLKYDELQKRIVPEEQRSDKDYDGYSFLVETADINRIFALTVHEDGSPNLRRFVDAQEGHYTEILSELRRGTKVGHWMWFIFPQLLGLGRSRNSIRFGISSLDEAAAYLENPVLGARIRECTQIVLDIQERTARKIFGQPDDLKFRSSMTLFAQAKGDNQVFEDALLMYFNGQSDQMTLDNLHRQ